TRDTLEMAAIACDQRRIVGQGNGGNQQVGTADFFQPFDGEQALELFQRRLVEENNFQLRKELFRFIEGFLRAKKSRHAISFQEEVETPTQDFNFTHYGCRDVCLRCLDSLK